MKFIKIFLFIMFFGNLNAQHLTITNSGETGTSGTNWSITGNTLTIASSGSANIHPSVISNHLTNTGDLTLVLPHNGTNIRDLYINSSIVYTGSSARTLTFNITNDIIFASNVSITASNASLNLVFRTALSLSNIDHGRIALTQATVSTNGGHLWMGGGSATASWNGLTVGNSMARTWYDDLAGISIVNSTINTNGGNIYMYGRSHNTADDIGTNNFGVNVENTTISSVSGSITIGGEVLGRYTNCIGTRIISVTSPTTITTTSGSINIVGNGWDAAPNANSWRLGAGISASSSTNKTIISSVSGNISVEGNANFTATFNDKEGLGIFGFTEITSRTGNITLRGTNTLETSGQYCNSIRFSANNVAGTIKIGFDGTNSYSGNILIEGNSIYQRNKNLGTGSISIQTIGSLTIQPTGNAFTFMRAGNSDTLTFDDDWNFGSNLGSLTFGKSSNTTPLSLSNPLTVSGPIRIFSGDITINENLNTVSGASLGNVLLKSPGNIVLAANKSITTSGAPVILWANNDNQSSNGSIALRNGSSIVTGSGSVPGGHIWLGGGSDGGTWNGLNVGNGYAVAGISFVPSNGGAASEAGVYLERNTLSSFGGNIKIAGDGGSIARAITTYGNTVSINSGSGRIEMDGQMTNAAGGYRDGILFGLHDVNIISVVNISSSASGDAISINGIGRGTGDGVAISGTLNIVSSGGGSVNISGNALGTGRSLVAGNFYHGVLNIFANSGTVSLNGNTKAVQVAAAIFNGNTTGPSKINIGQGGSIPSSSTDVVLTADNFAIAADGIAINTAGKVTLEPFSNSFTNTISYPISSLSIANTITGLTIGKPSNNSNIAFAANQTINGPILAYGAQISLGVGVNLTTTSANGHITLLAKNGFITDANSGTTRGRIMTAGGNIDINADSDDNNSGLLDIDWLTIDGNTGNVSLEGATFIWNTASGVSFPELYGTGALSIRSSSLSTMPMSSTWIALFNTKSSLTIGHPSVTNTGNTEILSCVNCNNTATNFSGKILQVNGPITLYGNTINISQNVVANNGGTISLFGNTLTIGASNSISSSGNLILAPKSNANTIGLGGATGTLSLPASYFSTNFSDGFANIQIGSNSQTGNIAANTYTLRDNMTFLTSGSLTLGGKPVLGNNNITLGSSISSISASTANYFQTNGNGTVRSTLANNASRLFPVGNAFYNGVTITNKTNASDQFSVLVKDSVLGNGDRGSQITTPHVKATWDISKINTNGGSGVDFNFNWNASQEVGGISTFVLNHHNDTVWKIANGTRGTVSGTTTKTINHTGYLGPFSPFAFGPNVTPLPVELIKFQTTCQSDYTQVDWTTASEKNNAFFELYKSEDATNWEKLYTTKGQGTIATETQYSFKDIDKKASYYRLKDLDKDGIENWSQIIFSDCKDEDSPIQIYPNPAMDFIKVVAPISENTTLNIISFEGKTLKSIPLISNQTVVSVKDLNSGIYMIEIQNKDIKQFVKLIKN